MLGHILSFSLSNRFLLLCLTFLFCIFGLYRSTEMNIDVFPDVTAPTVTIITEAHGLEAEEVEKLVSYQVETAMNGASHIRRIRSSSASGISIVWVEFDWDIEMYRARQIISERIPMVYGNLPDGVDMPMMAPVSSIMGEIMLVAVTATHLSPMEIREIADWEIKPQLQSISGVANVIVLGGENKEYQVQMNPSKMRYHSISVNDVLQSTKQSTASVSGGFFSEFGQEYLIKGFGRARSLEDIQNAHLINRHGKSLVVSDVSDVVIGASDKIGDASFNEVPAVVLTITKQPNANTLQLTNDIDAVLENLQTRLPTDVQLHNNIFRQSNFIENSINNLEQTLWEGAFCVVLVLFVFLMDWRTTLISLMAIPVSLLTSVIILDALNYDINTMVLGGMAIAIGVLVDDAIIDVENVYKRLRENWQQPKQDRLSNLEIIFKASMEIRSSIIIATFIIIVSFFPLFFLDGMEGKLLRPLGLAFIISVLASLLTAVSMTPVLCSLLLDQKNKMENSKTKLETTLQKYYSFSLQWILQRPKKIVVCTILIFIGTISTIPNLGRSFLPEFNEGSLIVSVVGMPGMALEQSNAIGSILETELLKIPEISIVTRRTGRAESDEHAQGVNSSEIDIPFVLSNRSKDEFLEEVRQRLSLIPGINISIGQPIAHRIDHMLSGTNANIAIKIFGSDLSKIHALGKEIQSKIQSVQGIADVVVDQQIFVPQIRIEPNRTALLQHQLTIEDVMHQIDVLFAGETVGNIYEGQRYFDLTVRLEKTFRNKQDQLLDVSIVTPNGNMVPLDQLVSISSKTTPSTISRENVRRKVVVAANVAERDVRSVVEDIQSIVRDEIVIPQGIQIEYGGQFESEQKASQLLLFTTVGAILVIWALLYVEFKNIQLAGIVLCNLPLALIGGIWVIYGTTGVISIASMIGCITLFGIATRNGILLISRYEDLRQEGFSVMERLQKGSIDRLNPILMTTCTTGLALIPLIWKGDEPGNEIQAPMALVILGGLCSSTLLNIYVIPCLMQIWLSRSNHETQLDRQ